MITVYSKPNCPYCDRTKIWLEHNNLPYQVVDVMADSSALEFIKSQGHKTVPQIYFNGSVLVEGGYTGLTKQDPNFLREAIDQKDAA
jgi:glutaredoxin-like protein NrdH